MADLLVGVAGRYRSGKDALSDRLVDNGFTKLNMSRPLQDAILAIDPHILIFADEYGLLPDSLCLPYGVSQPYHPQYSHLLDLVGWEGVKQFREVRRLLQRIGTDFVRKMDEDFWVRAMLKSAAEIDGPVVVSGIRFPNEYRAIRDNAGLMVRVVRPGFDGNGHESETAIDDLSMDFIVQNDGTLQGLYDWVDGFAAAAKDGAYDSLRNPPDDPIIDVYEDGSPFRRSDLKKKSNSGAVGLFQFMEGSWSAYQPPQPAPLDADYDIIRQNYRDALQRWHNKD